MSNETARGAAGAGKGLDVSSCKADARGAFMALLRYMPVALAVRELMRMRALAEANVLRAPLLDVGCGDGLFWQVLTRDLIEGRAKRVEGLVGLDINEHELALASLRLSPLGGEVWRADISDERSQGALDGRVGAFRTVIANCSLEHVPRLEVALANIARYLAPDGELWMFLPAPRWTDTFVVKRALKHVSNRIAGTYGAAWDGFYQHHHLYPAWVWAHLLNGLGFEAQIKGLGTARANHLNEMWLPPALVSYLYKCVFKHYPTALVAPLKRLYVPRVADFLREVETGAVVQDDLDHPEIIEWAVRCRRIGAPTSAREIVS